MGRKPDLERRAEIARKAVEVLRERGVMRTNMSELADALGVKRTTLYWYFKDIGELFDIGFEQANDQFLVVAAEAFARTSHPIDALEAVLRAVAGHYEQSRDDLVMLVQLWAAGRVEQSARVLERGRQTLVPFHEQLVELVRSGQAKRLIRDCDPEGLVDTLMALIHGCLVAMLAREADPEPMLETVATQLLRPLRIDPNER